MSVQLNRIGKICASMLAAFVLAGFSATVAAAEFHSETAPAELTGAQTVAYGDVFTLKAGTVKCKEITFSSERASTTSFGLALKPSFKSCNAFGFSATISVPTSCYYTYQASGLSTFLIDCGAGEAITVETSSCWARIGDQALGVATYKTTGAGSGREVLIESSTSGLVYSQENKNFPFCGGGAGTSLNGKLAATDTIEASSGGKQVGFWHA